MVRTVAPSIHSKTSVSKHNESGLALFHGSEFLVSWIYGIASGGPPKTLAEPAFVGSEIHFSREMHYLACALIFRTLRLKIDLQTWYVWGEIPREYINCASLLSYFLSSLQRATLKQRKLEQHGVDCGSVSQFDNITIQRTMKKSSSSVTSTASKRDSFNYYVLCLKILKTTGRTKMCDDKQSNHIETCVMRFSASVPVYLSSKDPRSFNMCEKGWYEKVQIAQVFPNFLSSLQLSIWTWEYDPPVPHGANRDFVLVNVKESFRSSMDVVARSFLRHQDTSNSSHDCCCLKTFCTTLTWPWISGVW